MFRFRFLKAASLVMFVFVLTLGGYALAAGYTVADCWYPGGNGSFWVYKLNSGKKVTVTVKNERQSIGGDYYKVITESSPMLGQLIDRILTNEPLPETFGTERRNPFFAFRQKEGYIAGYGEDANRFIGDQMNHAFVDEGVKIDLIAPSTEWVMLKELTPGFRWIVANLDMSMMDFGEQAVMESHVEGLVLGAQKGMRTEAGQFGTTYVISYSYVAENVSDHLSWISVGQEGLLKISVEDKFHAEVIRYEIKPSGSLLEPRAITSRDRLITTWGMLKRGN